MKKDIYKIIKLIAKVQFPKIFSSNIQFVHALNSLVYKTDNYNRGFTQLV